MKRLTQVQRVLAMREASRVERSHTIRHVGEYSDGQHSFDMLTLTLELRELTSAELMKAIIYHDLPERWLGDMPHPAKASAPEVIDRIHQLEDTVNVRMGWTTLLTEEETVWLHVIDRVEFMLWADDQVNMGNGHLRDVLVRCWDWFKANEIPIEIQAFLDNYYWQRTPDVLPS